MKRTNIDATQLELADTVVAIKRVSKTVKGGRTMRFLRSGCSWRQEWSCRCWYGQGC
mgnify:CR=1 FL=1